jgi:chitinase
MSRQPETSTRMVWGVLVPLVILLCPLPSLARPNRVVFGYVPSWWDATAAPQEIDFEPFTHLARAFLRPRPDGTLKVDRDYFHPAFEAAARAHGVQLLMSIGGESPTPDAWLAMARDPRHVQAFLDTLADLYRKHGYDGVDIDWEPPPQTDADGRTYAALLHAIRQRFPDHLLTTALPPDEYGVAHLPVGDVLASLDYVNAMAYDYSGPWSGRALFGANLHAVRAGPAHTVSSVDQDMANLIQRHHVPPAKVLLGMTFCAYRFRVDHLGDHFPAHGTGWADGDLTYPDVLDLLATGRYAASRDEAADASVLTRIGGGGVVTYDDPKSIGDKCDAAQQLGCAGVMIWHVGADQARGAPPRLAGVARRVGAAPPRSPSRSALAREVARLRGRPVSPTETVESLLTADDALRADHAKAADDRWRAMGTTR